MAAFDGAAMQGIKHGGEEGRLTYYRKRESFANDGAAACVAQKAHAGQE